LLLTHTSVFSDFFTLSFSHSFLFFKLLRVLDREDVELVDNLCGCWGLELLGLGGLFLARCGCRGRLAAAAAAAAAVGATLFVVVVMGLVVAVLEDAGLLGARLVVPVLIGRVVGMGFSVSLFLLVLRG